MVVVDDKEIKENSTELGKHLVDHQFFSFDEVYEMIDSDKINDAKIKINVLESLLSTSIENY